MEETRVREEVQSDLLDAIPEYSEESALLLSTISDQELTDIESA